MPAMIAWPCAPAMRRRLVLVAGCGAPFIVAPGSREEERWRRSFRVTVWWRSSSATARPACDRAGARRTGAAGRVDRLHPGRSVLSRDRAASGSTTPALDVSHRLKIEIVPTLIRFEGGREVGRTYGWDRGEWERLSGVAGLGRGSAGGAARLRRQEYRAGCLERLKIRFNETGLKSRRVEIGERRGRAGGDVRARLVGWAAVGAADRGARVAHARRHGARPAGGDRPGAARPRPGDGREDRDQRGDGRLQAGISAGRAGGGRGGARRAVRDARRAGDDDVRRAGRRSSTARSAAGSA